jgi:hypothetical protein
MYSAASLADRNADSGSYNIQRYASFFHQRGWFCTVDALQTPCSALPFEALLFSILILPF